MEDALIRLGISLSYTILAGITSWNPWERRHPCRHRRSRCVIPIQQSLITPQPTATVGMPLPSANPLNAIYALPQPRHALEDALTRLGLSLSYTILAGITSWNPWERRHPCQHRRSRCVIPIQQSLTTPQPTATVLFP
jgi:hypothetical protein